MKSQLSQDSDGSLGLGLSDFVVDDAYKDHTTENNAATATPPVPLSGPQSSELLHPATHAEHRDMMRGSAVRHAGGPPTPVSHTANTPPWQPTDATPLKHPGAPNDAAYGLPSAPGLYQPGREEHEGQRLPRAPRASSSTPHRQAIVTAPPQSTQRASSGLFSHLRSLGDYILPGAAAWRAALRVSRAAAAGPGTPAPHMVPRNPGRTGRPRHCWLVVEAAVRVALVGAYPRMPGPPVRLQAVLQLQLRHGFRLIPVAVWEGPRGAARGRNPPSRSGGGDSALAYEAGGGGSMSMPMSPGEMRQLQQAEAEGVEAVLRVMSVRVAALQGLFREYLLTSDNFSSLGGTWPAMLRDGLLAFKW
ncbi:hypothetical protein VOLCADRAFT_86474 [Volvox carteri f. nagariensis]|uniref:Uncharacterized protein n=1 Tax=Volvox carteri f. nagariensis TaxID=3068 RepID=D8TGT4_VOLCA|nr:uncharacterized protein VOLCADRAFT_86474 [Volvox carteri f. nagariensis]EFJ52954.1 hypothetical protein VOLCADRAFT_86474 [Volvox carteri f. nagariensis]|eukprot:XP_002945959.1 hypothetical protein VOLCADRAFT_86474 [Volvox carteri f. nagariensis]